jgi:hypothetical protein
MEDTDKTKEQEKLKAQEQDKPKSNLWNVPPIYLIGGVLVLFFRFQYLSSTGGNIQEIWLWLIVMGLIWWFLMQGTKKFDRSVLTPEEAEEATEKELLRKIHKGQIEAVKYFIGPNNGLQWHEGLAKYYLIEIQFMNAMNYVEYKRAMVMAEGDAKGYVTIQDNVGKLTGRETVPIISPLPSWMRRMERAGVDPGKLLTGGFNKQ